MKSNPAKFSLFLMAMALSQISTSQSKELKQQLHDVMSSLYPAYAPGAAILVIKNDSLIISEGFGITDMDSKTAVTANSNFRMASVSKQFTAFCILTLVHQHKMSLEDPVSKYLPGLPAFADAVWVKHLLTHSSGVQDYESLIPKSQTAQVTDADVVDFICKTDSLYFAPGSQFRYSNTGYCLLTQIIEKVSGISYPEFIRQQIFVPLRMSGSLIMESGKPIPERAYGYHNKSGKWQFADQSITSATMGDGCVYTSVVDYLKWMRALWSEQLFPMSENINPLLPHFKLLPDLNYGYGWFTLETGSGSRSNFHSGESTGFHNIVFHQPKERLLICIFSNSDDERVSAAFDKVAKLLQVRWPEKMQGLSLFDYLHKIYE